MPEPPDRDALERVREQVEAAHAAAERLAREARAAAESANRSVPPRGWDVPREKEPETQALAGLLDAVRGALPPELLRQLAEALRQLLLAIRALIDWYLERLDRSRQREVEVEDIPIE
jgi:hypothetical protein